MSDYEQWQQKRGYTAGTHDTGGAGLFWVLVVVVALGALVFAGTLGGGSVPGDDTALPQGLVVPDEPTDGAAGTAATEGASSTTVTE